MDFLRSMKTKDRIERLEDEVEWLKASVDKRAGVDSVLMDRTMIYRDTLYSCYSLADTRDRYPLKQVVEAILEHLDADLGSEEASPKKTILVDKDE